VDFNLLKYAYKTVERQYHKVSLLIVAILSRHNSGTQRNNVSMRENKRWQGQVV